MHKKLRSNRKRAAFDTFPPLSRTTSNTGNVINRKYPFSCLLIIPCARIHTTTTKKEYVTEENGVKTLVKNEIEKTTFTENGANSTGTHTETIINKKGFTLPITGGMGTVLFSIAGFALMAGAAFVLLKGRRKDA